MPFRRPTRATWYVQFATPRGVVRRSTGTTDRAAAEEIERGLRALRSHGAHDLLAGAGDGRIPIAALTEGRVSEWLASHRAPRPRGRAAVAAFARFLAARADDIPAPRRRRAPRRAPARLRWIDAGAMTRLAEAQPGPFRALAALLGGTGIELPALLALRRRDVDVQRREIRVPARRGGGARGIRVARVADWGWRLVSRHVRALPPDAPLFPGIDRRAAERAHRAACEAVGIADYRLSDQRHSWAVRAVRAGMPAELVARQLGLGGPARVVAIYGRFMPPRADLERWEQLATAQDAERTAREKVALGHALYHPVYQARPADLPASRNANYFMEFESAWRGPRGDGAGDDDTSPRRLRR